MATVRAQSYNLEYFLKYPNIALGMSLLKPFQLPDQATDSSFISLLIMLIGPVIQCYQFIGMTIPIFSNELNTIPLILRVSESLAIPCLATVGLSKMITLLRYRESITALIKELEMFFPGVLRGQRCCMRSQYRLKYFAENAENLMRITSIFFTFSFILFNSLPIALSVFEWLILGQPYEYHFQSNCWFPWESNTPLSFFINYFIQMYAVFNSLVATLASEFLFCFFLTQMRIHFDYLATTLETLDAVKAEADPEFLPFLINYHITMIRISKDINGIFNVPFVANFATSAIAICLMGYSIVMGISLFAVAKYSLGLLTFLIYTFFICYIGTQFTDTSKELHSAAFYHNWYDAKPAYRKKILIIITNTLKPQVLHAYKFAPVSIAMFMSIVKFSYQLFTCIRAI